MNVGIKLKHKGDDNMAFTGFTHNIGFILAAIWFIVTGICTVFSVGHPVLHVLLGILSIAAGAFILAGR
jgi:hypothetical protein